MTPSLNRFRCSTQNVFCSQEAESALRSDLRIAAATSEAAAAAAAAEKQALLAQIGESDSNAAAASRFQYLSHMEALTPIAMQSACRMKTTR